MTNSSDGRNNRNGDIFGEGAFDYLIEHPFWETFRGRLSGSSTLMPTLHQLYEQMFPEDIPDVRTELVTERIPMFSETIFKNNIVAVRQINETSTTSMVVQIYERTGLASFPELLKTQLVYERGFSGGMAAMIRHSYNWIEKLDREYRGNYWNEERIEWGISTGLSAVSTRIFFKDPTPGTSVTEFVTRIAAVSSGAGLATPPPSDSIPIARVVQSFQRALDDTFPMGSSSRRTVMERFVDNIRATS